MSLFSRFDLVEASVWSPRFPSAFDLEVDDHVGFALNLLNRGALLNPNSFDLLPFYETAAAAACDMVQIPTHSTVRRLQGRAERAEAELRLRSLSDRVAALEVGLGRALKAAEFDRKYRWTAEIKGEKVDWKYKWAAEARAGVEKSYTWSAEVKGKGKNEGKVYTFEASAGKGKFVNKEKKEEKKGVKLVEIEERNAGAIAIRKTYGRYQNKGKRKELSPQDAAVIIQMAFRAHLVRCSKVVRCLRDLAVAKAKLKEIRARFHNFSYRCHIADDAEECQRFSERIIVLLLTVDAIEEPDYTVRAARKSMIEELEYMLDVVDPQPPGKLSSLRRRKFDLPVGGPISNEMARGVAEVVQMLED